MAKDSPKDAKGGGGKVSKPPTKGPTATIALMTDIDTDLNTLFKNQGDKKTPDAPAVDGTIQSQLDWCKLEIKKLQGAPKGSGAGDEGAGTIDIMVKQDGTLRIVNVNYNDIQDV